MKQIVWIVACFSFFSVVANGAEFALRYDPILAEQGFTSPLIEVSVNGTSGTFLVDSGASVSVVSSWLAEKARIQNTSTGTVGGSSGASDVSKMAKVDLSLTSSAEETEVYKSKAVVIVSLPEVFRTHGLAGILSPQQLLKESEVCLLDLKANPSMTFQEGKSSTRNGFFPLSVVISPGPQGTQTTLYTLHGKVEGTKANFIVDTGADGAGIGIGTAPGKKLLPRSILTNEKVGGITGKPEFVRLFPHAKMRLLSRTVRMKIRLQPISSLMPADGMLGMQFLKNCSLMLTHKHGSISCQ